MSAHASALTCLPEIVNPTWLACHALLGMHIMLSLLLAHGCSANAIQDGELWTLQLSAVACLSIAAKMEEGVFPDNIAMFQARSFSKSSSCQSGYALI